MVRNGSQELRQAKSKIGGASNIMLCGKSASAAICCVMKCHVAPRCERRKCEIKRRELIVGDDVASRYMARR